MWLYYLRQESLGTVDIVRKSIACLCVDLSLVSVSVLKVVSSFVSPKDFLSKWFPAISWGTTAHRCSLKNGELVVTFTQNHWIILLLTSSKQSKKSKNYIYIIEFQKVSKNIDLRKQDFLSEEKLSLFTALKSYWICLHCLCNQFIINHIEIK